MRSAAVGFRAERWSMYRLENATSRRSPVATQAISANGWFLAAPGAGTWLDATMLADWIPREPNESNSCWMFGGDSGVVAPQAGGVGCASRMCPLVHHVLPSGVFHSHGIPREASATSVLVSGVFF